MMVNLEKGFSGAMNFFGAMGNGTMRARRGEAMNTEVNNHTVDTCVPGDTSKWETGIKRDGTWIIVEQYKDSKEATEGHTKWVIKLKENPNCELKDIDIWGLNEDEAEVSGGEQ